MRIGSLCTGAGQLDMAAAALFPDGAAYTAWACETDPDASLVIDHRLCRANHGDITAVDWRKVEPVDVIVAGYPCQDLSNAGKRAGIEGAKSGIWRNVADAVRVLRPRLVCLENVASHLARGFGRVLGDLAELGYDTQWTCLRASDVGAPHQRNRVFIVAAPADPDGEPLRFEPQRFGARHGATVAGEDRPGDGGLSLLPAPVAWEASRGGANARFGNGAPQLSAVVSALLPTPRATDAAKGGPNQHGSAGDLALPSAVALLPTPCAGDSKGTRNATAGRSKPPKERTNHEGWTLSDIAFADRWAQYGPAIRRWEQVLGRPAPEPTITGKRGGQRLSGAFTEWMMGWPESWVSEVVDNNAAVRISGNGVVPQQAFAAYLDLTSHLAVTA